MKKILFIILCTTIFSCNSSKDIIKGNTNRDADSTKTNTYVVEYDFQTGVYKSNNMPLRVNNPVVYKITNVNRLAYEVSVKSKDSILADSNWSQQNLLDQIKAQDQLASLVHTRLNVDASLGHPIPKTIFSDDFHKDVKPEQIKAFNEDLKKVNDSQKIIEDMAMLYVKRSQIEFKITAKNNDLYFQREILDTVRDIGEKAQLETQMLRLNNEIVELTEQRKAVIDDIDKKTSALVKYQSTNERLDAYRENLAKLRTSFTKLRSYYNNLLEIQVHNNKLHEAGRNPILTHQKFEQLYKIKLDSLPDRLSLYENSYRVFSELYSEFNLDYTTIINSMDLSDILNYGGRVKLLEPVERIKQTAESMNNEILRLDILTMIHNMRCNLNLLKDKESYEFVSAPVQPTNDLVSFDINIETRKDMDVHNSRKFNHKEYTKGGVRLDFGVGLALQYIDDAPIYEMSVNSAGINSIAEVSKNNYFPSIVGMATMSFRSEKVVTWGMSAGIGVNVTDGKIQTNNFYFGPSLILGRYERLCLTAGGTVKGVSKLRSGYSVTDISNTNDISSFTTESIKIGVFMSVTYNLTKGIKQNIKYLKQ